MRREAPLSVANVALTAGVALAIAIAIGFTVTRHSGSRADVQPATADEGPVNHGVIYLRLPPARPARPAPRPAAEPLPSPVSASVAPTPGLRNSALVEPFEPPAPPISDTAVRTSIPAGAQLAALPPAPVAPAPNPAPPVPLAVPVPPPAAAVLPPVMPRTAEAPISVRPGDSVPALRTVELAPHEIHRVPDHDMPVRRVTVETPDEPVVPRHREARRLLPAPSREPRPAHEAIAMAAPASIPPPEARGRPLDGPAIVTAPLELNVDGKPLRLLGVKLPAAGDMCRPGAAYAARSCPDVSRQALVALVGPKGPVSCRVMASGVGAALPAMCNDRKGEDLGAYLVGHGFALADGTDGVDYSAAENQAKSAHTGLWHYR